MIRRDPGTEYRFGSVERAKALTRTPSTGALQNVIVLSLVALIVAFLGLANPSGPTVGEFARVAPSETTLIFLNVQVVDDTEDDEIEETEVRSEEIVEGFWNAWALKI